MQHAYFNADAKQIEKNPSEKKTVKKDSVPTFENDISEDDNPEHDNSDNDDSEDDDDNSDNEDSHIETDVEAELLKSKFPFVILTIILTILDTAVMLQHVCLCGGNSYHSVQERPKIASSVAVNKFFHA